MGGTNTRGKDQLTRGTQASADRKVKGDREKFDTYKGEKRTARTTAKAPRREKRLGDDFPLGAAGLYLTLLGFAAFVAASLYWVVVIALPKA